MHNHHHSGDSFSFPSTPNPDSAPDDEFEFGSLTPESPNSPADHIFFKGRLLPQYSFPHHHPTLLLTTPTNHSLATSSRSNSSNSSRSSSCNSARTSSSDSSERRLFHNRIMSSSSGRRHHHYYNNNNKMAYGCSQRWQYITPVPGGAALSRDTSRRRKEDAAEKAKTGTATKTREDRRLPFGRRIFRWVVMACKECHALEPSRKEKMLREDVKL